MNKINLQQYKCYLVNNYRHECDNTEIQIQNRISLLNSKYSNEYLEKVIFGTYNFVNRIIDMYEDNYCGYINIPLECEPDITYINLNLTGGWMSDTVVSDSANNFYSIGLLKKIFGDFFSIEPGKVEITEEYDEEDDFSILSEIPSYYLYIQCKKEIIDNYKKTKVLTMG